MRARQLLIGASISIPIAGGSVVLSSTIDGCSAEYVIQTDKNDMIAVDKNGDVLKIKGK